jgi:hypothetical protein
VEAESKETVKAGIMSAGLNLRKAVKEEVPLQVAGTINAYCARLAERAGFKALYLSGAGAANASFGLPDLRITTLNDVCEDVRRITATTQIPLLVDADTGWGSALPFERISRDECGGGACLRNDTGDRDSKRRRRPDANARAAVRRSELSLLRGEVGSTVYKKSESLNV